MASNPYTTNLELQLDSRDISATDGDSITTWTDSSAAGNDATQSTASRKPIYKTNIIGTHPVVRFSSSNTKSLYGTFSNSWTGFGGATIFILSIFNEHTGVDNAGAISLHNGAGTDATSVNNIMLYTGTSTASINDFTRSTLTLLYNSTGTTGPIGTLRPGAASLMGAAIDTSATGVKYISEQGPYTTGDSLQYTGTPSEFIINNRFISGTESNVYGFRSDVAMVLVYKEYMSDANITTVKDWILDEFDLHTQAAGGGGMIQSTGMAGGMNG